MTKIRTQKGAVIAIQVGGGGEESKYSENYTLDLMEFFLSVHSLLIPQVSRQVDWLQQKKMARAYLAPSVLKNKFCSLHRYGSLTVYIRML